MSVQMIEWQEVQMFEISDDALEISCSLLIGPTSAGVTPESACSCYT